MLGRFCTRLFAVLTLTALLCMTATAQTSAPPRARVLPSSPSAPVLTAPQASGEAPATPLLSNSNAVAPGPAATGPAENYGVYKHVDERGRVTYTNFPVKGGQRLDLAPLTVLPIVPPAARSGTSGAPPFSAGSAPAAVPGTTLRASTGLSAAAPTERSNVAIVSVPPVERDLQKQRDNDRRKILESELAQEEKSLALAQGLLDAEVKNGEALQKTMAEMAAANITSADVKRNAEKIQDRTRSLKLTVSEHNRNIEALRKELSSTR